ncbi:cytochrome b562 [Bdellovibrio sp. HCB337]|uniref:cytochrome b562 n=1 Tax=Bdellovibrio sp. HCB337 TaxID=3394358 RepID=UPI0039A62A38
MRKFFALTLMTLSLTAFSSFAEERSLEDNMKDAEKIFKAIGGSLTDASKNAENAAAALQMAEIMKITKEQVPTHLQEMPEAKRAEAFKGYQDAIQQSIDLINQLAQAFTDNDNAAAKAIYRQIKDHKQDGHDQYDP